MPEPGDDQAGVSVRDTPTVYPRPEKDLQQRHREVIKLLELGVALHEVATCTGYSLRTVQYIGQRYRETGLAALEDRRTSSHGTTPLLAPSIQCELRHTLQHPPPGGGVWTGPKVAQWMTMRTGKPVARQRGWEYLRRLRAAATVPTEALDNQIDAP